MTRGWGGRTKTRKTGDITLGDKTVSVDCDFSPENNQNLTEYNNFDRIPINAL